MAAKKSKGAPKRKRTLQGTKALGQANARRIMEQDAKGLGPATSVTPVPQKIRRMRGGR